MNLTSKSVATKVYKKTDKGRDEVISRSFGLTASQRTTLILIDGSRALSEITEMLPNLALDDIIAFLSDQSFIAPLEIESKVENKSAALPSQIPLEAVLSIQNHFGATSTVANEHLDANTLRQIKDFMTTTASTYLGLMAAGLIRNIEETKDASSLLSLVGQWHMALRESKHGNRLAGTYLDQVALALSGKN